MNNNQIEVTRRIEEVKNNGWNILNLANLGIVHLPEELALIPDLEVLALNENKISDLPDWLFNITSLKTIDLRSNKIKSLPPGIGKLYQLEKIYLSNNLLTEIPESLAQITNLIKIDIFNNDIKNLPKFLFTFNKIKDVHLNDKNWYSDIGLIIDENAVLNPPIEILSRGIDAINSYFEDIDKDYSQLFEAKLLIVGEAGAGKTTLANKLIDINYELKDENSTEGVDVTPYTFLNNQKELYLTLLGFVHEGIVEN